MPKGLAALMSRANEQGKAKPPVEKWNPPFCGDLDIRIFRDGSWSYMGSKIGREALVKLFSSVLRKEDDGRHYLVTPVEKIGITVDDAPFIGVELHVEGVGKEQVLTLRTNVGDVTVLDGEHALRFERAPENDGLKPYVLVRGRLEARLSRALLYELAELFEETEVDGQLATGVWSSGTFFSLAPEFLSD
ncbi:DUF1285 domain-containing protein [Roseibium algae]|uniref:DUF1285 domain-containing protein n=1 Tax=Roseibium algae TaxID=3123038 RepID=A0ABU8TEX7_9HYPH